MVLPHFSGRSRPGTAPFASQLDSAAAAPKMERMFLVEGNTERWVDT
jgi:hypothetical protein